MHLYYAHDIGLIRRHCYGNGRHYVQVHRILRVSDGIIYYHSFCFINLELLLMDYFENFEGGSRFE